MKRFRIWGLLLVLILLTFFAPASETYAASTKTLSKIEITPASIIITGLNQESRNLSTIAYYSDGTTEDITNISTYSSTSKSVVTVQQDAAGNKFYKSGTLAGKATITAAYGVKRITAAVTVKAKLTSISITPAELKITGNNVLSNTVAVKAYYENGTSAAVTTKAKIESDNPEIVTITSYRLKSGAKSGIAVVTAAYKEYDIECTSVSNITVVPTLTKINISPAVDSIIGQNTKGQKVKVTGEYSDNTTKDVTDSAVFTSSASTIAFVKDGYITSGAKSGKANITAKFNNKTAVCTVTVTPILLKITPSIMTATINGPQMTGSTIRILAYYSDNTTKDVTLLCKYKSTDNNIAYVDVKTLKSGQKSGTTTITVTFENMMAEIVVTAKTGLLSISASPAVSRIIGPNASGEYISVTGDYSDGTQKSIKSSLAFSSSNSNIAYVKSNRLVSGKNSGNAAITVKYSGKSITCEVCVKPLVSSLRVSPSTQTIIGKNASGKTLAITAVYADGSLEDVTDWAVLSSSDNTIVTVKGTEISSGTNYGSAKINVSYGGKFGTCLVDVPAPPLDKKPTNLISTKEMEKKHGKIESISVSSENLNVHTTNSSGGYIRIVSSFPDGFSMEVSPKVMFNTSNGNIAYVTKDSNGNRILMSGNKTGTAKITAIYGGKIISFYVTVTAN
ncbi:MAG: hypothetical protein ACM3KR_08685 [Deltaproteobacteria bacterium]